MSGLIHVVVRIKFITLSITSGSMNTVLQRRVLYLYKELLYMGKDYP
jgi:hypothetical protein